MSPEIASYCGYTASVFIVLSFVLKDIKKIRFVNMIGCILFVLYGIYSGMLWPIIIPNAILCFVQIYHLIKKEKVSS
ncbi:uroporphyrinogen decarboxylase [Marnyiella aurantia]|uniref:Uroporphyrinogen decarboxylase n=1 Tax=Marnyiella aurantia TaxID=2758037 RepID=A0A7D7R4B3_9FLAO|nr:uroporphyrinogen decarboxylase [Marnyiella aurantia]MBA5247121.1 uroporphyrinogen decarboxylase [Marnyiella aurantia]QMS97549.1 uroporphyrinogen decarboxylase [Marnyiella aurantia]